MTGAWGESLRAVDADMPYDMRRALDVAANWFGGQIGYLDLFVASCTSGACDELVGEGLMVKRFRPWGPVWRVSRAGYRLLRSAE